MQSVELTTLIGDVMNRIIQERGGEPHPIDGSTEILGGSVPFDSLDLAVVVVELQAATGKDPFQAGFIDFTTVNELACLFAE